MGAVRRLSDVLDSRLVLVIEGTRNCLSYQSPCLKGWWLSLKMTDGDRWKRETCTVELGYQKRF